MFGELSAEGSPPSWWRSALALLCMADEAARDLGFQPARGRKRSFQGNALERQALASIAAGGQVMSFSSAETDVACVLPKSRTPNVGCTLRSLSHNLALLPPRGLARAYWLPGRQQRSDSAGSAAATLNCLLIPMPFRIPARAFRAIRNDGERFPSYPPPGTRTPYA